MYMNQLSGTTLEDVANEWSTNSQTWGGATREIRCNLDVRDNDVPTIEVGGTAVRATKDGLASLATFLDIPPKFFSRQDPDIQQHLMRALTSRTEKQEITVYFGDNGLQEVRKAGEIRVQPERLVEAAMKHFPGESLIVDRWNDHNELRLDVIFPEDYERGLGGDGGVGDITHGGVRIGQDRKANTAPWVQPFMWRRVCTNGMEVPDPGLKISALGAEVGEIEALFEAAIAQAVSRLDADIQAFYDLRSQQLGNDPTGALHRAATEQNLPLRTIGRLEDLVPALMDEANGNPITMFDMVNLMTNQANSPEMLSNRSGRRNLQRAGGVLVNDHAERCGTCHSRLGR